MRFLKTILVISIFANILLGVIVAKSLYVKYKQNKAFITQPELVSYQKGRDEVLSKLPSDSNEIVMLGNSLTQGFEWNEVFKANVKNRGINSDITKGILNRLDDILRNKPIKIFIEIGVNDLAREFPIDTIFSNYKRIIETIKLQSPTTTIYIQNILPTSDNIQNIPLLNQMLKSYCNSNNLTYIDLYSKFVQNNNLNPIYDCGDGVHLNGNGYLLWCSIIETYIFS